MSGMANPWRGEVTLEVDGAAYVLRLTLGALAALEADLGESTLVDLVERFEAQRFSSADVIALLKAGLTGGGHREVAEQIAHADISGGPVGAARAAAQLLVRAFAPESA